MANVPPEIMNHLRAQLHKDRYPDGIYVPRQRRSTESGALPDIEPEEVAQGKVKGLLSRLALRVAGPELSGD